MDKEAAIWKGDPIVFSRNMGKAHGLVVGKHIYTFNPAGGIETCLPLSWGELLQVVKNEFKNPGAAMAAHASTIKEEMQKMKRKAAAAAPKKK